MNRLRFNLCLLVGAYGISFAYIMWRHLKHIVDGGHRYLQGDWLINFADGPVRRGLSGEIFLSLSELLHLDLLPLLGIVQALVLFLVIGTLLQVAWSKGLTDSLTLTLLSPLLVLFWVNDSYTPFRKELLGYLIFVPLFLMRNGPLTRFRLIVASAFLSVSVAFHEANAVFFVPLALVLWMLLGRNRAIFWICINGLITLAGSLFSLLFMSVPSVDGMCQRLLEEGASPEICRGSISWLSKDIGQVVEDGWHLVAMFGGAQNFMLATILVIVLFCSVAFLFGHFIHDRETKIVLSIGLLSIMPLYFLGGDWGRWVSIQMFVTVFLLLAIAEKQQWPRIGGTVSILTYGAVLALNLSVGVFHMVPTPKPGFIFTFATGIYNLLT